MLKIKLFIFLLICSTNISFGQIIFQKAYTDPTNTSMSREIGFIETHDKGFLLGNVATLMKLDSTGNKEWRYEFNTPVLPLICVFSIIDDNSNGYLLTGTRMFLSLDSNYNITWMKDISSNYFFYIVESKKADSVSFIHAGEAGIGNDFTPCLIKTDTSGNIIWVKIYNSNPVVEAIYSMEVASDGSRYVCGASRSVINTTAVHYDGVVLKINSSGTILWSKRYANFSTTLLPNRIKATIDGNLIVTGKRNLHRFLMEIDTSGNIIWQKLFSTGTTGNAIDVLCTQDSGYAIVGEVTDNVPGGTGQSSIFIKTDSLGNLEWSKYMGGFGSVSASKIIETSDNGYAIAGRRILGNGYKLNLIKTDSLGNTGGCLESNAIVTVTNLNDTVINFLVTDSTISATTVPYTNTYPLIGTTVDLCNFQGYEENDSNSEFEIYPNPNTGIFNISFTTAISHIASISIFDLLGKKLYEMELNDVQTEYKVKFNPKRSGVFLLLLNAGGDNYFKKIVIYQE